MKKVFLRSTLLVLSAATLILSFSSCDNSDIEEGKDSAQENSVVINSGYIPLPEAEYNKIPLAETVKSTKANPSSVSLYCPPVRSQGNEGSCVSWGVGYAARSISWRNSHGGYFSNSLNLFSPEFIYNQIRMGDCSEGSYVRDGLNLIQNQGVCLWSDMPYTNYPCDVYPTNYQYYLAYNYRISSYNRLYINESTFKNQLAAGKPIVVAGPVYNQFANLGYGEIQTSLTYPNGGHCYCVVGYDDSKKAFLVINSWGTQWGTNGYGWISYSIMANVWNEAYIINE